MIDAGVSGKRIIENMDSIGRNADEIDALIVSHDHVDHTRGAGVVARRHNVPIFITKKTYETCSNALGKVNEINHFNPGSKIKIKDLRIETFKTPHDASDPLGFVLGNKEKNLGVMTDIGNYQGIKEMISNLNSLVIESNHDLDLLWKCHYPYFLKQRIASEIGHLSNADAKEFVMNHADHSLLKRVVLGHLSENSNNPEIAFETMNNALLKNKSDTELTVAGRHEPTDLFNV